MSEYKMAVTEPTVGLDGKLKAPVFGILDPGGNPIFTTANEDVALDIAFILNDARIRREILSDNRTPSDYLWDMLGLKP